MKKDNKNPKDQKQNETMDTVETSLHELCESHENIKEYADEIIEQVKKKPLTSLLIAGGIGFVLSALFRS